MGLSEDELNGQTVSSNVPDPFLPAPSNGVLSEAAAATEAKIRADQAVVETPPKSFEEIFADATKNTPEQQQLLNNARAATTTREREAVEGTKGSGVDERWVAEQAADRRFAVLRVTQALPLPVPDVGQFVKNAEAIDAWVRTGVTS